MVMGPIVGRGAPGVYRLRLMPVRRMDIINIDEPKHPGPAKDFVVESGSWDGIFARVLHDDDDGHATKLVRALAHGENICAACSEMIRCSESKATCG